MIQKGGFTGRFNPSEVKQRIVAEAPIGYLPIPSQKSGICVSDSILVSVLYSDYLRDDCWDMMCHTQPCESSTFTTTQYDKNLLTYFSKVAVTEEEKIESAKAYLAQGMIRIGNFLANAVPSIKRFKSFEDTDPNRIFRNPEGEKCGLWLQVLTGKKINTTEFGLSMPQLETSLNIFNILFQGPIFKHKYEIIPESKYQDFIQDRYLCAILLNFKRYDGREWHAHEVCICKINGAWYYCNNNIGFAVPILFPESERLEDKLDLMRFQLVSFQKGIQVLSVLKFGSNHEGFRDITNPRPYIFTLKPSNRRPTHLYEETKQSRFYIFGPPITSATDYPRPLTSQEENSYMQLITPRLKLLPRRSLATGIEGNEIQPEIKEASSRSDRRVLPWTKGGNWSRKSKKQRRKTRKHK